MNKPKQIAIKYFANLRELTDTTEEVVETPACTPSELYNELAKKYGFQLPKEDVKVAVNGQFEKMTCSIKEGDVLAFIPPVAGG